MKSCDSAVKETCGCIHGCKPGAFPSIQWCPLHATASKLREALADLLFQFLDRIPDPTDSELESVNMAEKALALSDVQNAEV